MNGGKKKETNKGGEKEIKETMTRKKKERKKERNE